MKQSTIQKRIHAIETTLDRAIDGQYTSRDLHDVTSYIEWLYRYKHISYNTMSRLCDKAMDAIAATRYY